VQVVAESRHFNCVPVQVGDIAGDHHAVEVVPGSLADPIARVDRGLAGARLRAEIGAPGAVARADGLGKLLAVRIGARQPAEIAPIADRLARDEERHRHAARHAVLRQGHGRCQAQ
jgi:hypothetical protein